LFKKTRQSIAKSLFGAYNASSNKVLPTLGRNETVTKKIHFLEQLDIKPLF